MFAYAQDEGKCVLGLMTTVYGLCRPRTSAWVRSRDQPMRGGRGLGRRYLGSERRDWQTGQVADDHRLAHVEPLAVSHADALAEATRAHLHIRLEAVEG